MSLGLHERRSRRRQKFWWGFAKWTGALIAILAAGLYSYQTGSTLAQHDVANLQEQVGALTTQVQALQRSKGELEQRLAAANAGIADWQARYGRDVPTGDIKELVSLAQQKLEDGVGIERLGFLIGAAQKKRDCDQEPVTKRFIVRTPLYKGKNDAVSFGNDTVTVMAEGASSADGNGNPLARFDPAEPVKLRFLMIGDRVEEATGKLPLNHSVVLRDREYRFTVVAADGGFVRVTGDSCRYP